MTRLTSHSQLSEHQVHPDPTATAPLLPASAPLPHQATPLHKPPRWWSPAFGAHTSSTGQSGYGLEPNSWAKLRYVYRQELAEFFGTFLILIFGAGVECQVNMHYHSGETRDVAAYGSYFQGRLAWAAGVAMAVWVSGGISGGHCNPSVTIALALFRGFPWSKVVPFIIAQRIPPQWYPGLDSRIFGHSCFLRPLGQRWVLATGAHDRAPVVEDPARLAGLPYWLAE